MSVLASKKGCLEHDRKFSKELFTAVADNLKVFTDEEWVTDRNTLDYKKVLIAVYVRTDVDNLVLLTDKDSKIALVSNVQPFILNSGLYPNILIDSGIVSAKNVIDVAFSFKSEEAMKRLVTHSTCYPVGAVETSKSYVLVFSVVLSADLLRDQEITLNEDFHFKPIETLHLTDLLQRDISESLVIVKSEDKKK